MITYRDTTFCVSPGCTGGCGRTLTPAVLAAARLNGLPVAVAAFCGSVPLKDVARWAIEGVGRVLDRLNSGAMCDELARLPKRPAA